MHSLNHYPLPHPGLRQKDAKKQKKNTERKINKFTSKNDRNTQNVHTHSRRRIPDELELKIDLASLKDPAKSPTKFECQTRISKTIEDAC